MMDRWWHFPKPAPGWLFPYARTWIIIKRDEYTCIVVRASKAKAWAVWLRATLIGR